LHSFLNIYGHSMLIFFFCILEKMIFRLSFYLVKSYSRQQDELMTWETHIRLSSQFTRCKVQCTWQNRKGVWQKITVNHQHLTDLTADYRMFYTSYCQSLIFEKVSRSLSTSLVSAYIGTEAWILLGASTCLCSVGLPYDGRGLATGWPIIQA
jgi:hypothetical protein